MYVNTIKIWKTVHLRHLPRYKEYDLLQVIIQGKKGIGKKKKSWLCNITDWTTKDKTMVIRTAHNRDDYATRVATLKEDGS